MEVGPACIAGPMAMWVGRGEGGGGGKGQGAPEVAACTSSWNSWKYLSLNLDLKVKFLAIHLAEIGSLSHNLDLSIFQKLRPVPGVRMYQGESVSQTNP